MNDTDDMNDMSQESPRTNELGQPIGLPVPDWSPRPWPPRTAMHGAYCYLEPLDPDRHSAELFAANAADAAGRMWTYMPYGPFADEAGYRAWVAEVAGRDDPQFHAIVDRAHGRALGVASFLRIQPEAGSIEVGHIACSPALQRTCAASEAMVLMMRRAFDELGYRRYEWKCDALNAASCAAARRLGLTYEGVFRQATVYKNRNRDTAWFAALDQEWPYLNAAFERWLAPGNFDDHGRQRESLSELTAAALRAASRGPGTA
jgi:RimJ/RimL family protein N-acetyltransferase